MTKLAYRAVGFSLHGLRLLPSVVGLQIHINRSSREISKNRGSEFTISNGNVLVKSWFMPQSATYEQKSGGEPDTHFQTLSKHSAGDGRQFGVQ
jgi:hypothetical protein